ncbi:MAG: FecR domain-containing protein [Arenicellales bacterium]|nr:FecR domain-containing protein [Arenicellales bacterium]
MNKTPIDHTFGKRLSGDARSQLVADRSALSRRVGLPSLLIALLLATPSVGAATPVEIGEVERSVNSVSGAFEEMERMLRQGDRVYHTELIKTGKNSLATLLLDDNTQVSLGADTAVQLDQFIYNPDSTQGAVTLNSARGIFRFLTGLLPSKSYKIKTPVATIGVRGTVFDVWNRKDGSTVILLRHGKVVVNNLQGSGPPVLLDRPMLVTTVDSAESQPTPATPVSGSVKAYFEAFDRTLRVDNSQSEASTLDQWFSQAWTFLSSLEFKPIDLNQKSRRSSRSNSGQSTSEDNNNPAEDNPAEEPSDSSSTATSSSSNTTPSAGGSNANTATGSSTKKKTSKKKTSKKKAASSSSSSAPSSSEDGANTPSSESTEPSPESQTAETNPSKETKSEKQPTVSPTLSTTSPAITNTTIIKIDPRALVIDPRVLVPINPIKPSISLIKK